MGELRIGRTLIVCDLAFGDNPDGLCGWCGEPLEGRRTRWCCDDCSWAYARNHYWTDARAAAVKRDGRCVRCGANGDEYERLYRWALRAQPHVKATSWVEFLRSIDPTYINELGRPVVPHPTGWGVSRENMLRRAVDVEHALLMSRWYDRVRTVEFWRAAVLAAIAPEILARSLEVNHLTPVLGRHAEGGCHHHLDLLETLCHRHHVAETNRQRAAGELSRLPSR